MSARIAILGVSGFIGKNIVDRFSAGGVEILGCDIHSGKIGTLLVDSIDLTNEKSLSDWLGTRDIDAIIYLASEIPQSFSNVNVSVFDNNVKMHKTVLNYWTQNRCQLIYASTCAIYGKSGPVPWREENAPAPENYYSVSKIVGEWLFRTQKPEENTLTVLRINAPYGVGGRKTVVNIFLENALAGKPIGLFGSGRREQDFLHVSDIANAFWLAFSTGTSGTFNIASGTTVTMKQLAEKVIETAKSTSEIELTGTPDPGEETKVRVDISKAGKQLGFTPIHSLESGLAECIKAYGAIKK
ncbi:MAG: NAD(P)-dependent oxidoreductase [Euryarchaeota archaeon]|nr:NAD(P)-dependent oxidoreductase [Euryarchaeota archaeon]MBU4032165.1 NAD(P)-dependent oxidoreductase [Candidatus Thermoplasmatota archaeon]MBU4072301.1 NAD(P)-dependent oxidoreductase [Candidatus Thermoplasmatota archaeon]MBU4143851.1 NAD(P)-dependent oxidoreductase [Candidatus Thermoplasmatota archaeon]